MRRTRRAGLPCPLGATLGRDLRDEDVGVAELRRADLLGRRLRGRPSAAVDAVLEGVHRGASRTVAAVGVDEPSVTAPGREGVVVTPELAGQGVLRRHGPIRRYRTPPGRGAPRPPRCP